MDLVELILPQSCACCGEGNRALCRICRLLLMRQTAQPFDAAGEARSWPDGLPCIAAGVYRHELACLILAFKNGGRTDVLPPLARAAARALEQCLQAAVDPAAETAPASLLLVPVPSSAAAYRRRGFSPALELARRALRERPDLAHQVRLAPVLTPRRVRGRWLSWCSRADRSGQKGLGAAARGLRARGSLSVGFDAPLLRLGIEPRVQGCSCLLLDDVLTTGATLAAARSALEGAGARVLGALVLGSVRAPSSPEPAVLQEVMLSHSTERPSLREIE